MPITRLPTIPALTIATVLGLAGCGGQDDESSEAGARAAGPEICGFLDEDQLTGLAGKPVEDGVDPSERRTNGAACSWADSKFADASADIFLGASHGRTWAMDLEEILAGELSDPSRSEEYQALVDTADQRAALSDEQACQLWAKVVTFYDVEPKDGIVFATSTPSTKDATLGHVARAEMCRDGIFTELRIRSNEPIPAERAALVKTELVAAWEKVKDRIPADGELG